MNKGGEYSISDLGDPYAPNEDGSFQVLIPGTVAAEASERLKEMQHLLDNIIIGMALKPMPPIAESIISAIFVGHGTKERGDSERRRLEFKALGVSDDDIDIIIGWAKASPRIETQVFDLLKTGYPIEDIKTALEFAYQRSTTEMFSFASIWDRLQRYLRYDRTELDSAYAKVEEDIELGNKMYRAGGRASLIWRDRLESIKNAYTFRAEDIANALVSAATNTLLPESREAKHARRNQWKKGRRWGGKDWE